LPGGSFFPQEATPFRRAPRIREMDEQGRARTDTDWIKEAVREELERGQWVTGGEIARRIRLWTPDSLRQVKKRIEELRDEGCPIVSLPGKPGPGYLWIGDPDRPEAQEAVRLYEADMKSRMGRMVKHLATIKRATEREVQTSLFGMGPI